MCLCSTCTSALGKNTEEIKHEFAFFFLCIFFSIHSLVVLFSPCTELFCLQSHINEHAKASAHNTRPYTNTLMSIENPETYHPSSSLLGSEAS